MALAALTQGQVTSFINTFTHDNPAYVWMKTTDDCVIFCNKKSPVLHLRVLTANWNVKYERWDVVHKIVAGPLTAKHWQYPYDGTIVFTYVQPHGDAWWKMINM